MSVREVVDSFQSTEFQKMQIQICTAFLLCEVSGKKFADGLCRERLVIMSQLSQGITFDGLR